MDDTHAPGSGIGTTALGRLALRVFGTDGHEEVVKERRWPDMQSARAWCERIIDNTDPGTEIIEIQVFEEAWWHARSWSGRITGPPPRCCSSVSSTAKACCGGASRGR